jgi:hypothetical protein
LAITLTKRNHWNYPGGERDHPAVTAGGLFALIPSTHHFALREQPTCLVTYQVQVFSVEVWLAKWPPSLFSCGEMHGLIAELQYLFLQRAKDKADS